jgi:hypothetical protein
MQSTNLKFAWKDWRKWRTNLSSYPVSGPRFEHGISQIQNRTANHFAASFCCCVSSERLHCNEGEWLCDERLSYQPHPPFCLWARHWHQRSHVDKHRLLLARKLWIQIDKQDADMFDVFLFYLSVCREMFNGTLFSIPFEITIYNHCHTGH